MQELERMWRMGLAALLALALVLVWPPVGQGSASPENHLAQSGPHGHHAHLEQNDQVRVLNAHLDADCDASAIGCCMMAHCCPGISVAPHDLPVFVCNDEATAASAVRGTGSDPGMVPPPPRRMSA